MLSICKLNHIHCSKWNFHSVIAVKPIENILHHRGMKGFKAIDLSIYKTCRLGLYIWSVKCQNYGDAPLQIQETRERTRWIFVRMSWSKIQWERKENEFPFTLDFPTLWLHYSLKASVGSEVKGFLCW